jgi:hypothetical protein
MNIIPKLLLCAAVPLAGLVSFTHEAQAQRVVYSYPSPAYVAAYEPIYYNGHAHYYYNNHWWYRDHGGWRGYDREPGELYGRRGEWGGRRHWR